MSEPMLVLVVCGVVLGCAPVLVAAGRRRAPARLSDALAAVAGHQGPAQPLVVPDGDGILDRFGAWLANTRLGTLSSSTRRTLSLQGRSIGDFMIEKAVWSLAGLLLPVLVQIIGDLGGLAVSAVPVAVGLVGCAVGWFVPDLRLRGARRSVRQDAGETLLTFIDLVTLARLANQSATRSLLLAASLTHTSVMVRVRAALERARLQQQAPWDGLDALARDLDLPQLGELVEVLRLDEQGASLAGALRARAAEMRDAHLTAEKMAAQQVSESMTVWMVVPVMVLGLVLITPPLLTLAGVTP
ncbi:hypothetical protein [Acidipropionibacterium timonense]|uniref:hypothetical protein n=1 Tax=Acidipropionibacterium timonense TaxID=2161818 RepID=UPI00103074D3|nr:hypothetical protein [Acidipropionibacterium timonense]